jgi:perosamine synthetase
LSRVLREIPGIQPARLEEGTTRSAFHLFMFRYGKERFAGLERSRFIQALAAEGVPASSGYGAMNRGEYVQGLARNPGFLRVYGEKRMNEWLDQTRNGCPRNDQLCQEAVWLSQNVLLGTREQMEQIAAAILKIQRHAAEVARRG